MHLALGLRETMLSIRPFAVIYSKGRGTNARILSKPAAVVYTGAANPKKVSLGQHNAITPRALQSEFDDGARTKGCSAGDAHFSMTFHHTRRGFFQRTKGVIKSFRSLMLELSRNNCVSIPLDLKASATLFQAHQKNQTAMAMTA